MKKLPDRFIKRLKEIYGEKDYSLIMDWFSKNRLGSFRINTLKSTKEEIETLLDNLLIKYTKLDFIDNCYLVGKDEEYKIRWTREYYDWKIYFQSVSSQIPSLFLDIKKWEKVLDITAAPGSKTTQISALLDNTWEIVACDMMAIRFDKLNHNIKLQGCTNVKTIKTDANNLKKTFEPETFDKIIFDAPCSAEWRINLDNEKTFWFWSERNTLSKSSIQKEIIRNTIDLLKTWWTFVYSTCTLAPEENEEVVDFVLKNYPEFIVQEINLDFKYSRKWIESFWKQSYNKQTKNTIKILPSEVTEWFFVAKFIKK